MYLPLAEKMIEKHIKDGKIEAEAGLLGNKQYTGQLYKSGCLLTLIYNVS